MYMGCDVTIQNLKSIFLVHKPTYLFTYLPQNNRFPISQLLDCMTSHVPDAKLIIGDYTFESITPFYRDNLIEMNYDKALNFLIDSTT